MATHPDQTETNPIKPPIGIDPPVMKLQWLLVIIVVAPGGAAINTSIGFNDETVAKDAMATILRSHPNTSVSLLRMG